MIDVRFPRANDLLLYVFITSMASDLKTITVLIWVLMSCTFSRKKKCPNVITGLKPKTINALWMLPLLIPLWSHLVCNIHDGSLHHVQDVGQGSPPPWKSCLIPEKP